MPWKRTKLLPGSKILIIQKRWWKWIPFTMWYHIRTFTSVRTDINKLKEVSVALERKLIRVRGEIEILEKEYDASVKALGKGTRHDSDGGQVTQWKYERNPWYIFSLFQWAIPFVDEPITFDPQLHNMRRRGHGAGPRKGRDKEVEISINSHKKDLDSMREEMEQQRDPDDKHTIRQAVFTPGTGIVNPQRNKGESPEQYNKRKEEGVGKLEGME